MLNKRVREESMPYRIVQEENMLKKRVHLECTGEHTERVQKGSTLCEYA